MIDTLRPLLYPIGFIANLCFGLRFFLQWIQSEKAKTSVVSRSFWQLSWVANISMLLHGFIQIQYPVCLIQMLNACIAWRNLNLMGKKIVPLKTVLLVISFSCIILTSLFMMQAESDWMRSPTLPWSGKHASQVPLGWHLVGFFGMFFFASRYWIQWWLAERHRTSFLGTSFWLISCGGAFFSLAYAIRLIDPVNILGFSMGLLPYIRNLMLLKNKKIYPSNLKNWNFGKNALFLFAGEQSGDVLGGRLVSALKQQAPELTLYGVGGPEMAGAGMAITHPMERFQVMGFSDVLKALPRLYRDFRKIKKEILIKQPAGVVLIDYPDFNMRLAKSLRKQGYKGKIIHYVCPSIWAWRKNRVGCLAKTLDHLLTILPFEQECFKGTNLSVTYVGHPLVAAIDCYQYDHQRPFPTPLIAIFPGSRRHEIELNLPVQLAAAKQMGCQLAVSVARPQLRELIQKYTDKEVILVSAEQRYELMKAATGALATSGTIVLELGLHSVPTVVTYQLSSFNYLLGRYAFRIHLPYYTLVNIICAQEVYPEFIDRKLSFTSIYKSLQQLVNDSQACHRACARLRSLLQTRDASLEAASTITHLINN